MKKILSLVLAAMMIFSVLPAAFAAETAVAAEVSEDVVEAITLLNDLGIYKGYENGDMGADDLVQRYQMSIFATRFKSGRVDDKIWATTENDSGFTDVVDFAGASDYVLGMISYAAQAGIVNGTGDNKFEPNLYVKYKEAITMVVRALGQVYSAASYPWAYIQFANDNGLLAGIDTDIAPDDFVSRGVIAQLLYNALFAEINGVTVAEKNFGIGYTTVMVTASNSVVYEAGASTVLSNGKIRFAEIDVQGEPVGADYHVDAALFGLADAKAANKAVGTLYNVYYKGNFTSILSAESLAVVYENRGWDKMTVKAQSDKNYLDWKSYDQYVTVDGTKYQVVKEYTELNSVQGPYSDAKGTAEMKVYLETGADASLSVMKPGYKLSADGSCIYDLTLSSGTGYFAPVAFYSEALDLWYKQDGNSWAIVDVNDYFQTIANYVGGFGIQEDASAASAYANITVSANERMTIREYGLGYISFSSNVRTDIYGSAKASVQTFTIKYYDGSKTTTAGLSQFEDDVYYLYGDENTTSTSSPLPVGKRPVGSNEYFSDEYTWTGLPNTKKAGYILYYINHETRELDILEYIDFSADGDDSYLVSGYIRGFDLASNSLTFGANYDTYYYDYDSLKGATIVSKSANGSSNYTTYNYNYLSTKYNVPVTMVVVDGKVVHIDSDDGVDYIIIDNFVSFEEDGVVANAWSTVDNGYTQIKIGSYNGWSVGGIDYWYYVMSPYLGNASSLVLPFKNGELYKVIDVVNGIYDITDKGSVIAGSSYLNADGTVTAGKADVVVNAYGYVEGVYKTGSRNEIKANKYVAAADSDYWMILDKTDTAEVKVYSLNGKLNPITFYKNGTVDGVAVNGAEFYKAQGDYVIIIDNAKEMSTYSFLSGDVAYYKYNTYVNQATNSDYLVANTFDNYNYTTLMTNVLTGKVEAVRLGNDSLLGNYSAYQIYSELKDGKIYKAEDGVITEVDRTYDMDDVVEHYYTSVKDYNVSAAGFAGMTLAKGTTAANILSTVTADMTGLLMPGANVSAGYYNSAVTFIYESGSSLKSFSGSNAGYVSASDSALYNSTVKGLNNLLAGNTVYKAYWVVNKDTKTATVWVVNTGLSIAKAPTSVVVAAGNDKDNSGTLATDGSEAFASVIDSTKAAVTATASLNEVTDKLTVTFDLTNLQVPYVAADHTIVTYLNSVGKAGVATVTANGANYAKITVEFDAAAYAASDVALVRIDRAGNTPLRLEATITK